MTCAVSTYSHALVIVICFALAACAPKTDSRLTAPVPTRKAQTSAQVLYIEPASANETPSQLASITFPPIASSVVAGQLNKIDGVPVPIIGGKAFLIAGHHQAEYYDWDTLRSPRSGGWSGRMMTNQSAAFDVQAGREYTWSEIYATIRSH